MPPPSTLDSATSSSCCCFASPNSLIPSPRTIGDTSRTISSTRPASSSPWTSVGLPQTSRFWSCLSSAARASKSAAMIVELFHSAFSSVLETTYFGIALNLSANGSPERCGHAAAKPSYVTRPSSMASCSVTISSLSSPVSSLWNVPDQRCGSSTTLSRVMKQMVVILPMRGSLVVVVASVSATNEPRRLRHDAPNWRVAALSGNRPGPGRHPVEPQRQADQAPELAAEVFASGLVAVEQCTRRARFDDALCVQP